SGLPAPGPVASANRAFVVAWWELPGSARYLWDHFIEHLVEADRRVEAESLVLDLRWISARLRLFGPSAVAVDLTRVEAPGAQRLLRAWTQVAHLLGPTEPAEAVMDIMHRRL